jgi:hypothetical protein
MVKLTERMDNLEINKPNIQDIKSIYDPIIQKIHMNFGEPNTNLSKLSSIIDENQALKIKSFFP